MKPSRRPVPLAALVLLGQLAAAPLPVDDGYRGIWYANQPVEGEYRYK
jgi:hypothetical protein